MAAILANSIYPVEVFCWVIHGVTRVLVVLTCIDYLSDEWVLEDDIAERLVVDRFDDCVLVRPLQLEHFEYVKPDVFDLRRVLVD